MTEDAPMDHHAETPRAPISIESALEQNETQTLSDAEFINEQLDMWVNGPPPLYRTALVEHIVAESHQSPSQRPAVAEDAIAWEERLSTLAHNELLDQIKLSDDDPSEHMFSMALSIVRLSENDLRNDAIDALLRLHKAYYRTLTPQQKNSELGHYHSARIHDLINRVMVQHSIPKVR